MSQAIEHNPGDHEDPLPGPTWIIGFLGAVLLAVIMLGLTALYYNEQAEEDDAQVVQKDPLELEHLRRDQLEVINKSAHRYEEMVKLEGKDEEQKVTSTAIPIDQAITLTLKEYGKAK